ncbi:MAG: hypothetical protein WC378_20275 [Opitutaceae bacterium]
MKEHIHEVLRNIPDSYERLAASLKTRWLSHRVRVSGRPAPSGLDIAIYDRIAAVPPGVWNGCNRAKDIFLSPEYLGALEKAPPANIDFRYVVFSEKETPVAIAYFQIVKLDYRLHQPATASMFSRRRTPLVELHERLAGSVSHRILICGNALLSGEHGYVVAQGDASRVLHAIAEAAYAIRKSVGHHVSVTLLKDFCDRNRHPTEVLSRFGYYAVDAGPSMIVPIRESWTSFDHYLKQMKAKYRRRVTDAAKKGAKIRRQSLDSETIVKYRDELYALYGEVVDEAGFRLFFLSPDYLAELKKRLGDRFVCDAYFDGATLVGFTTRIFNGREMEGYTHGVNYAVNKSFELYQNFLLDDIRAAISAKCTRVNTGRTSIAMKSAVGAVPETMKCHLRFSGKVSNLMIKPLLSLIKPSEEHCRRPFDDGEGIEQTPGGVEMAKGGHEGKSDRTRP